MTETEARTLREAANAAVRRYSRMTRAQLAAEHRQLQADRGIETLWGGPGTKDELVAGTLELRGYGVARLNEATHVVAHDVVWPDCQWCQAAQS